MRPHGVLALGRAGVVYRLGPNYAQGFWLLDLSTNAVRQLVRFANRASTTLRRDIAPDGNAIVFDRMGGSSDLVLIDLPKK